MSVTSVFLVSCMFGMYFTKSSSNAEAVWTKEQMAYFDTMKGDCQREIDDMKRELYDLKQSFIEIINSKKNIDGRQYQRLLLSETMPVAFYVHLSANINVNGNQIIPYDVVKVNVGNGYNTLSGQFQAPVAGLYHFSNTVMSEPGHGIHVEIVKNGITIGKNWADHTGYESGSVSVIAELNAGDLVWVKDSDNGLEHLEHDYNSFTGFLISS